MVISQTQMVTHSFIEETVHEKRVLFGTTLTHFKLKKRIIKLEINSKTIQEKHTIFV